MQFKTAVNCSFVDTFEISPNCSFLHFKTAVNCSFGGCIWDIPKKTPKLHLTAVLNCSLLQIQQLTAVSKLQKTAVRRCSMWGLGVWGFGV